MKFYCIFRVWTDPRLIIKLKFHRLLARLMISSSQNSFSTSLLALTRNYHRIPRVRFRGGDFVSLTGGAKVVAGRSSGNFLFALLTQQKL